VNPQTKGAVAVARAKNGTDNLVLAATFVGFFFLTSGYFIVTALMAEEMRSASILEGMFGVLSALVGGGFVFVMILLFGMFQVRMQRQMVLGNSLQVEYSDYAWLRDWANHVAADLAMPRVEMFVTQDPVMNAYAFGFARPYCIVLNSGSIRYLTQDELKAIVVHEMAHIKYGHTTASVYLLPFLSMPFVSIVTGWIAGFWNRRTELTSDRLALMYLEDGELVKNALVKIHVGPDVAQAMNQTARDWLRHNAERPMNRFAQTFSSHPFLVRRLAHIDRYAAQLTPPTPPASVPLVEQ
jgi:Zn-dependent protease with chaperone function